MNIDNLDALKDESIKSKRLGFNGKAAIHPSQINIIRNSFLPTKEELEEAKDIIRAFNESSSAVLCFQRQDDRFTNYFIHGKKIKTCGD